MTGDGKELFVGRSYELGLLRDALEAARAGRGSLWLLVGEPGIGKTRTAAEIAADASDFEVYWGRCREGEGAPAFWPWTEIFRGFSKRRPPGAVGRLLGASAGDLVGLVPEWSEVAGPQTEMPVVEGSAAQFRLFDGCKEFLDRVAAEAPLLLVIDDIHWSDLSSLQLLQHLVATLAEAPIVVVGTYRPAEVDSDDTLASLVGAIARGGRSLDLAGLSRDDVAAFLASALGGVVAAEVAAAVHEKTAGNALFMGELARLLALESRIDAERASSLAPSEGIRQAIRRRLAALDRQTQQILRAGSVIGRDFELRWLDPAWRALGADDHTHAEMVELLDDAVAARVLEPGDEIGRYRFAHPLIRDSLEAELGAAARARCHAAIATAMEEAAGPDSDRMLGEIAHHYVGASGMGCAAKALLYAARAGDHFRRQFAFEEAAQQYGAALRVYDSGGVTEGEAARSRVQLLLDLGRTQASLAYEAGGREAFEEAAGEARRRGDPEVFAQAVLGIVGPGNLALGGDVGKARLVEEALDWLGEDDHPLRALLLTRSLLPLYYSQETEAVRERSSEALAIADRVCDEATLGQVIGECLMVLYGPDHVEQRSAMAERVLSLATQSNRRGLYLKGHGWSVINLLQRGEIARARRHLDQQSALADEQRQALDRWQVAVCRATLALLEGDLEGAERLAIEACAVGEEAKVSNPAVMLSIQIFRIRLEQGRLADIESMVLDFTSSMAHIPAARGPLALAYGHMGRLEDARSAFEAVAAADFADYPRDSNWLTGLTDAAHVCWFLGDRERAATLYELLEPRADLLVIGSWFAACSGAVAHYLGLLATVLERWNEADRRFAAADETYERMGARALRARARLDRAEMLLRAGRDSAMAQALLATAAEEFDAMGMDGWRRHAGSLGSGELRAPQPMVSRTATFLREGDYWTVSFAERTARLRDLKGLRILRTLLREPGREFHVADLMDAAVKRATAAEADPDAQAREAYRRRVADLREALAEAEENNDIGRVERFREELEQLATQLAGAYSPSRGRGREIENLRKAVAKNLRAALQRIDSAHPALVRHLRNALKTGTFCSYDPENRVDWRVD